MAFQVKQRSNWVGGICFLVLAGFFLVMGMTPLIRVLSHPEMRESLLPMSLFIGVSVLFLGIAAWILYDCAHPKVLTADVEHIRVLRRQKVIGQVSFAEVESITIIWVKPSSPYLAGGLVGLVVKMVVDANAKLRPGGVRIRLRDPAARDLWWPRRWFYRKSREIRIAWPMQCSFERVAQELRAREMAYLKEHGLLPADEGEKNPFDFG